MIYLIKMVSHINIEYFMYGERNSGWENWNKMNYNVGPAFIKILGYEEKIIVTIKDNWKYMNSDLINITKKAWNYEEKDIIIISDTEFHILTNFSIIKNYIDYVILFI